MRMLACLRSPARWPLCCPPSARSHPIASIARLASFPRLPPHPSCSSRSRSLPFSRSYQHSSAHAPASRQRSTSSHSPSSSNDSTQASPPAGASIPGGSHGIAYSRHELIASWHAAAREISPLDISFNAKDQIDVNYMIVRPDGSIEKPEEKLDKDAVLSTFGLLPRDLRSLDAHLLDVRPSLLVCSRSLVLCTPVVRAIISPSQLVLIGADKENPVSSEAESRKMAESVVKVMKYLDISGSSGAQSREGKGERVPFELSTLEALLLLTVRGHKEVATTLQEKVYSVVPQLRFGVSPAELRDLLECKRTVEDCLMGGRAMQEALSAVLSEDEDLAGMYLTDKMNGRERSMSDHQTAELLLEYYERRLDETNESCERLSSLLAEVDSNISLVLASTRVRLQNLELQTAIATLALGAGTTIAGFFGMNLVTGYEENPYAFYFASGGSIVILGIGWIRLIRARRSQLFLRSALRPRQNEDLLESRRWAVGPPLGGIEEERKASSSLGEPRMRGEKDGEKERARVGRGDGKEEEVEEPMRRKDGTQI
ncbi:hypothetical protein JCM21900_000488 [Sporobolomyces salmonicolor]